MKQKREQLTWSDLFCERRKGQLQRRHRIAPQISGGRKKRPISITICLSLDSRNTSYCHTQLFQSESVQPEDRQADAHISLLCVNNLESQSQRQSPCLRLSKKVSQGEQDYYIGVWQNCRRLYDVSLNKSLFFKCFFSTVWKINKR